MRSNINKLSNSKKELEEITYAVSHDLQEPMRKVQIFSSLITKKFSHKLTDEGVEIINRINKVIEQVYGLLNDLVFCTNLLNPNETFENINLNHAFSDAGHKIFTNQIVQLELDGRLPEIYGSRHQVEMMLFNIFDKCLKYQEPARPLLIQIKYELVIESGRIWEFTIPKHYHKINIINNGMGLDWQFKNKVFELFKRLKSNSNPPWKGIGLSLARRVMLNHKGLIMNPKQKTSAGFVFIFPAKDTMAIFVA